QAELRLLEMQRQLAENTGFYQERVAQLEANLLAARMKLPDRAAIDAVIAQAEKMVADDHLKRFDKDRLLSLYEKLTSAEGEEKILEARNELLEYLQDLVKDAKFKENLILRDRKATASFRDAARSEYELAIRDNLDQKSKDERLEKARELDAKVAEYDKKYEEAKAARMALEERVKAVTKEEDEAKKELEDVGKEVERLKKAIDERDLGAARLLESPILDAFGGPKKPHQIWLPDLKIKYPLNEVARFDRCMTCHQGMDKTLAGTASDPAFPQEKTIAVQISPAQTDERGKPIEKPTFENVYGLMVFDEGLIDDRVTVGVWPKSRAAKAGLRTGDVLVHAAGGRVNNRADAQRLLIDSISPKSPPMLAMEITRGLPNPYCAHPKLDLIGSDASPHPFGRFGCSVCHDGQGTATAFQHAEHAPNTLTEEVRWRRDYGWFENHYWDYPQRPKRFLESNCLKCHHNVTELEASDRFAEAPAPKLVHGFHLVRKHGCFGCHEVKGFGGPNSRIGPDLRLEPDYHTAAGAVAELAAPLIEQRKGRYQELVEQEQKIAREKAPLDEEKTKAASDAAAAAEIDRRLKPIETRLATATAARLAIEAPLAELERLETLARRVESVPEDSAARNNLIARVRAHATARDRAVELNQSIDQLLALVGRQLEGLKAVKDTDAKLPPAEQKKRADFLAQLKWRLINRQRSAIGWKEPLIDKKELMGIETAGDIAMQRQLVKRSRQSLEEASKDLPPDDKRSSEITAQELEQARTYWPTEAGPFVSLEPEVESLRVKLRSAPDDISALPIPLPNKESLVLIDRLKDIETPGDLRKVGPSLRHVAKKLDRQFLVNWITDPRSFRPSTRMPRVFGNWKHLDEDSLQKAKRYEAVEIRGIADYLLAKSLDFEYSEPPKDTSIIPVETDEQRTEQVERGRSLFVTRGCIACHQISDEGRKDESDTVAQALKVSKEDQGPDLSHLAAKLTAGAKQSGRDPQAWLYSWLKQPTRYHARTKMPNLLLDPVEIRDPTGKPVPATGGEEDEKNPRFQMTDPAADIAAFLLALEGRPVEVDVTYNVEHLRDLARLHLQKAFRGSKAEDYLNRGIHDLKAENLKGDEIELLVDSKANPADVQAKMLRYVGRRAISKYGCFGCHDIPGFEDAKPIGTGL
ncbi:MAG: c-type cytochrome, partial [Pirellulales bacterium]